MIFSAFLSIGVVAMSALNALKPAAHASMAAAPTFNSRTGCPMVGETTGGMTAGDHRLGRGGPGGRADSTHAHTDTSAHTPSASSPPPPPIPPPHTQQPVMVYTPLPLCPVAGPITPAATQLSSLDVNFFMPVVLPTSPTPAPKWAAALSSACDGVLAAITPAASPCLIVLKCVAYIAIVLAMCALILFAAYKLDEPVILCSTTKEWAIHFLARFGKNLYRRLFCRASSLKMPKKKVTRSRAYSYVTDVEFTSYLGKGVCHTIKRIVIHEEGGFIGKFSANMAIATADSVAAVRVCIS
jgi:hypothetical protein